MNLNVMRALVHKDLRLFLTDRRALLITIAAPLLMASFFGFIFSGNKGEMTAIKVVVVNEDGSELTRKILDSLAKDKTVAVTEADATGARAAVEEGKVPVALLIPKDFGDRAGRAFLGGTNKPELQLLHDPSHATEMAMVRGILIQHVMQAVSWQSFGGQGGRKQIADALQSIDRGEMRGAQAALRQLLTSVDQYYASQPAGAADGAPAPGLYMPYDVREEAVTSRDGTEYNGYAHSFAGMGVQFVFLAAIESAVAMLLERQKGLWRRVRAAPVSKGTVLGARMASGALIAATVLACLFGFGRMVFNVRVEGSVLGFLMVCAAIALCCSTFGLFLAAIGRTPAATRGAAVFVVLILTMLGGAWVPTFLFPPWMQTATLVAPTRWAVDGLDGTTWRGLGLQFALMPTVILLGFSTIFGALAVARFRWEEV